MKNLFAILFLALTVSALGQTTDATLTTQAQQIKNETTPGANTANRVGTHLQNLVYSKKSFFIDGTASGTDTYSVTLNNGAVTALTSQWFVIKFTNANTGAATLNINSIGAKALKKTDGSALSSGDIPAGSVHILSYDGTNLQVLTIGGGGGGSFWPTDGDATLQTGVEISGSGDTTDVILGDRATDRTSNKWLRRHVVTVRDYFNVSANGSGNNSWTDVFQDSTTMTFKNADQHGTLLKLSQITLDKGNFEVRSSGHSNYPFGVYLDIDGDSTHVAVGGPSGFRGLEEHGDYSANYTDSSLVRKSYVDAAVAGSSGGHVIEDEGTPLTQRSNLNFTGAGVTVTDAGGKTVVTIPGGSSSFVGLSDGPGSFSGKTLNYFRVNAGETALEYRTPSQARSDIGALSTTNFVYNEVPSGSINSSNTAFTIANTPTTGTVTVYLNGLRQKLTTDYSISGTTITFVTAPSTGDTLICDYLK